MAPNGINNAHTLFSYVETMIPFDDICQPERPPTLIPSCSHIFFHASVFCRFARLYSGIPGSVSLSARIIRIHVYVVFQQPTTTDNNICHCFVPPSFSVRVPRVKTNATVTLNYIFTARQKVFRINENYRVYLRSMASEMCARRKAISLCF